MSERYRPTNCTYCGRFGATPCVVQAPDRMDPEPYEVTLCKECRWPWIVHDRIMETEQ